MKECTDRVIGVIDDQGTVVSCNQLTWIGEKWEGAVASALNTNDGAVVIYGDKTFKPLASRALTMTMPPLSRARRAGPAHLLHGHRGPERSQVLLRGEA